MSCRLVHHSSWGKAITTCNPHLGPSSLPDQHLKPCSTARRTTRESSPHVVGHMSTRWMMGISMGRTTPMLGYTDAGHLSRSMAPSSAKGHPTAKTFPASVKQATWATLEVWALDLQGSPPGWVDLGQFQQLPGPAWAPGRRECSHAQRIHSLHLGEWIECGADSGKNWSTATRNPRFWPILMRFMYQKWPPKLFLVSGAQIFHIANNHSVSEVGKRCRKKTETAMC